jgi:DNA repair exonuclease SbcCD ATPase subunit
VSEISSGRKELGVSLEEVITGEREDTLASGVLEKLDRKIVELKRGEDKLAKTPGPLAASRDGLKKISEELENIGAKVAKVEDARIKLVETSQRLDDVDKKLDASMALLERSDRRMKLEELEQKYEGAEKLLDEVEGLEEKCNQADRELNSIEGFRGEVQIVSWAEKLKDIEKERVMLTNDIGERRKDMTASGEDYRKKRLGLASLVMLSLGGAIGSVFSLPFPWGVASCVILLALAMWSGGTLVAARTRLLALKDRIERMSRRLVELGNEEGEVLSQAKCSDLAEFKTKKVRFDGLVSKRSDWDKQLKIKLGDRDIDALRQERRRMKRQIEDEKAELGEDLKLKPLSAQEYNELQMKVKGLKQEQRKLEDDTKEHGYIIKNAEYDAEDQVRLEEEKEELKETLAREERRLKVYEKARKFILKAKDETLSSTTDRLEERIQRHFAIFSDDKYQRVKMADKASLRFEVYSGEKSDWVNPSKIIKRPHEEELSKGAIDEFYLACRLALVELIYGDKRPPIILDDPFVNFDEVRLAKTLDFCREMAKDYQLILFTLSDRYDSIADKIIPLS